MFSESSGGGRWTARVFSPSRLAAVPPAGGRLSGAMLTQIP
jgi:hypothetical protein